ncbi:hypothetical protein LC593_07945 [Nostoc sp. CHAB 5844]|nr:hypothetical protein [Nostoc sp. CHAB 5844]
MTKRKVKPVGWAALPTWANWRQATALESPCVGKHVALSAGSRRSGGSSFKRGNPANGLPQLCKRERPYH